LAIIFDSFKHIICNEGEYMPTALEVANRALLRRENKQQQQKQQQLVQEREQARLIDNAIRRNYVTAVMTLDKMENDNSLNLSAEASAAIEKLINKARFIYNGGRPVYGGVNRISELTSILNWVINLVHGEHSEPAIYELVVREASNRSLEKRKISVPVFLAFIFFEYLFIIDNIRQIRSSEWKDFYDPICVITCLINITALGIVIQGNAYGLGDELVTIGKLFNLPEEIQDDEPEAHLSLAHS